MIGRAPRPAPAAPRPVGERARPTRAVRRRGLL